MLDGERKREKMRRKHINMFFGFLRTKFFSKMAFFRKIDKHNLCSEGKKTTRIFVDTICFWQMVLLLLSGPQPVECYTISVSPPRRYRTPSAIGSAIGTPLCRPISHRNTGGSPQPPSSKPLGGAQPLDGCAIVSKTPVKQARNKSGIEAAILNRVLDRDWTLNRRGPLCCVVTIQITRHYKIGASTRTGEKPKMALLVAKVPLWEGASKGVFTICDTQKLCLLETLIL